MSRQTGTASFEKIVNNNSTYKKNRLHNSTSKSSVERTLKENHKSISREEVFLNNISENFKDVDTYDGLFSTQQLKGVDFSDFKNHVFFDSAVDKTYYSYSKILNEFPYDKNSYEFNQYKNSLDGYTKYIYDNFIPKSKGYIKFTGSNEVFVKDTTGNILNDYVDNKNSKKFGLLDINKRKFSFDFWLYVNNVNDVSNFGTQIVFQKRSGNESITIYLKDAFVNDSDQENYCKICLLITTEKSFLKCESGIKISQFNHVNFSIFPVRGKRSCKFYYNGKRTKTVTDSILPINYKFSDSFKKSSFTIGNGLSQTVNIDSSLDVTRSSGLIGYIDEFRFFIENRSDDEVSREKDININSRKSLNIYYRFNEPSGVYLNNNVVLDFSGNRTHGLIRNNNGTFYSENDINSFKTLNSSITTPVFYERGEDNPVLFSRYGDILSNQNNILENAKNYDRSNPNVIWKFFPKSLFVNSSDFNGDNETYVVNEFITASEGEKLDLLKVKVPKNNSLINLALIWARFFDSLKCYIDQISDIVNIDYDNLNNNLHSSIILPYAVAKSGFKFEEIFPEPIIEKIENKNFKFEKNLSEKSIRQIQNSLWKRFLVNSQDYIRSKGTESSIKSIFNSFGLESDSFVNIREFNSQNKINFYPGFKEKNACIKKINFLNNDLIATSVSYDNNGFAENRLLLECDLYNNEGVIVDIENDWSLEYYVKFDAQKTNIYNLKQSLFRIDIDNNNEVLPTINVVFERSKSDTKKGNITFYINETSQNTEVKSATIKDVTLLSGKVYYLNLEKQKMSDDYSIYTLSLGGSDFSSRNVKLSSSVAVVNIQNKIVTFDNSTLRIGYSNKYTPASIQGNSNIDFCTSFEGEIISFRLWSQILTEDSKNVHKTDFQNSAVKSSNQVNARNNLFINVELREDYENQSTNIVANYMNFFNDINNNSLIQPKLYIPANIQDKSFIEKFDYIIYEQSSNIDYPENFSRVNINSYNDASFSSELNNTNPNPNFSLESNFDISKDIRLTIDFSTANFINKEISKIILVNDYFTQSLSNRSSLYEDDYQKLTELRNIFYSKLEKEVNISQMYQVYKYFDNILEKIIYDAIPTKVHYHGFNFVYESAITERSKYQYKNGNSRFPAIDSKIDFSSYNERIKTPEYWNSTDVRSDIFSNSFNSFGENQIRRR